MTHARKPRRISIINSDSEILESCTGTGSLTPHTILRPTYDYYMSALSPIALPVRDTKPLYIMGVGTPTTGS